MHTCKIFVTLRDKAEKCENGASSWKHNMYEDNLGAVHREDHFNTPKTFNTNNHLNNALRRFKRRHWPEVKCV